MVSSNDTLDAIIIGGGQSGLALGYHLSRRGRSFVILDRAPELADSWRHRWDSLHLITPCPYNDLPGLPFPGQPWSFPHKSAVVAYLEAYVKTFELPVRLGHEVTRVARTATGYEVHTVEATFAAPNVVVATGAYQAPRRPAFSSGLDTFQIHSSEYRNAAQIPAGDVLVVGCGNSGAGIVQDLARSHRVHLSLGRTASRPRRILGRDIFWWGRVARLTELERDSLLARIWRSMPDTIIGTSPRALARDHGVTLHTRAVSGEGDRITFADGSAHRFQAIIWATGYRTSFPWLDVPVCDSEGAPVHQRGVTAAPGLYFLGMKWQHHVDSSLLGGVGRDAEFLATHMAATDQRAAV